MAAEDRTAKDTAPPPSSRSLRRFGLIVVAAAVVIAVIGILERRGHEAEVKQWTQEQAVPIVAVITPQTGAASRWFTAWDKPPMLRISTKAASPSWPDMRMADCP